MVASIVDVTGSRLLGVHTTYLDSVSAGKADVPAPKKVLKCAEVKTISGSTIRLRPYQPGCPLTLAEGIETALAVHEATGWPV